MGEWRTEQRHDAVAHHLVNGALEAMHSLRHVCEHRVENLPRLLGIPICQQLHRALEVSEKHRDLLALTFEGRPGDEDLLGEMFRDVALGGTEPGSGREAFWGERRRMSAPRTELCFRRQRSTAL